MARKERKYHYIYKITNKISGRFYIGMHSTDNLDDEYFGSGKLLWYSLNKYGKEKHTKEILEYLPNRLSLKEREEEIVNAELINEKLCMNLKLGGYGGCSKEVQQIWSTAGGQAKKKKRLENPGWAKQSDLRGTETAKKQYKNGRKSFAPNWTGKKHSEETKRKISKSMQEKQVGKNNSQYGSCWIYNLELKKSKKIKKEELNIWLLEGWIKGRKQKF